MDMRRRDFLIQLPVWSICCPALLSAQPETAAHGCALTNGLGPVSGTSARSGNGQLDRALIAEVRKVDQVYQINPGYRFFREVEGPNAFATDDTFVNGTSGTVLFGLTLMESELRTEYGGAAVAGIAGHEGAHILQYARPDVHRRLAGPTAVHIELHADFMAGYYFSRTGRTERSLIAFADSLFSKGDYDYNSRGHHGTPQQRVASMRAGYAAGTNDLARAIEQGVAHVLTT